MPDSKVISTLIICLALIASAVIYVRKDYFFSQKPVIQTQVVAESSSTTTLPVNDDWKKMLTSTIGTNDPIQIVVGKNTATPPDDNTLTAQLSKNFFSLYLQDQKNGVPIDDNEAMNIANQALSNVSLTSQAKQYGLKDIKMADDISDTEKRKYANALLQAIGNNTPQTNTDAIEIFNTAVQSQNLADFAKLDPIIKAYKGTIAATLLISVPKNNVGNHVVYLNSLSDVLYDIQQMRNALNDSAMAYVAFSNYQKDIVTLQIAFGLLDKYFNQ